jgi:hypothetical protein
MAESVGTTFVPLPLIYCVNPEKGRVPAIVPQGVRVAATLAG